MHIDPAGLREFPEVEHVIADRNPDARRQSLCGEHAIREILDRKVRFGINRYERAEFWVVGVGHGLFLLFVN
jgi:hypothetical protein